MGKPAWVDTIVLKFEAHEVVYDTVAAGPDGACGLSASDVYCWGSLWPGSPLPAPAPVDTDLLFRSIAIGSNQFCGTDEDGAAHCWGDPGVFGIFGSGPGIPEGPGPVAVAGGHEFQRISLGRGFACGLRTDGAAYCWGSGASGQLGVSPDGEECPIHETRDVDGYDFCRTEPVPVSGGLTFRQVSAGAHHTCGITLDGSSYCWGNNVYGQLGADPALIKFLDNGTPYSDVPLPVTGDTAFAHLTAGGGHTCGLTQGGAAFCWGDNSWGQIGDGRPGSGTSVLDPTAVAGDHRFIAIEARAAHTCGLAATGEVWCWGAAHLDQNGQEEAKAEACFRNGSYYPCHPTPVPVSGDVRFRSISVGVGGCGIAENGVAHCWGDEYVLGAGDYPISAVPLPVAGSIPP